MLQYLNIIIVWVLTFVKIAKCSSLVPTTHQSHGNILSIKNLFRYLNKFFILKLFSFLLVLTLICNQFRICDILRLEIPAIRVISNIEVDNNTHFTYIGQIIKIIKIYEILKLLTIVLQMVFFRKATRTGLECSLNFIISVRNTLYNNNLSKSLECYKKLHVDFLCIYI